MVAVLEAVSCAAIHTVATAIDAVTVKTVSVGTAVWVAICGMTVDMNIRVTISVTIGVTVRVPCVDKVRAIDRVSTVGSLNGHLVELLARECMCVELLFEVSRMPCVEADDC